MTNTDGYSLTGAFVGRMKYFFGIHSLSNGYLVLKTIYLVLFTIPFLAVSLAEFIVLTAITIVGKLVGSIPLLGIIPAALIGIIYTIVYYIFMFLFTFFTLPDLLNRNN
ncbi:MAG: hypothetical protein IJC99_04080 [Clostridia bacterium]|nr:hypothetical protein [Clostridia bacterium]